MKLTTRSFTQNVMLNSFQHLHLVKTQGFTLIELLVVVLIIGILAAVAMPQYKVAVAKSKLHTMLPFVKTMVQAEEAYFMENGEYTKEVENLTLEIPGDCHFVEAATWSCGKDFMVKFTPTRVMLAYCPGKNTEPWNTCGETRDYQFNYYYAHSDKENKISCVAQNDSSLGERVCKSLN